MSPLAGLEIRVERKLTVGKLYGTRCRYCIVERLHSHTQNARFFTCIAVKRKGKYNYTNEVEDVYIAVV